MNTNDYGRVVELLDDHTNELIAAGRDADAEIVRETSNELRMRERFERVAVTQLEPGDYVENVGTVNAPVQRIGVFVLVETYATEWRLGTGKPETCGRNNVWHATELVTVDRDR